mmetsp:Transcript_21447/g.49496  ORF Transcript_21447/g.49496 Transcript_21447/m.49496 type:complete len:110 (+) Transcript_21447:404-733(+)
MSKREKTTLCVRFWGHFLIYDWHCDAAYLGLYVNFLAPETAVGGTASVSEAISLHSVAAFESEVGKLKHSSSLSRRSTILKGFENQKTRKGTGAPTGQRCADMWKKRVL